MIHLWIGLGALLTVAIETGFFACFGFRDRRFILACIFVNLATNFSLNYFLLYGTGSLNYETALLIGEILVVLAEAGVYLTIKPKQWELIPLTLAANIVSFLAGLGYWALIGLAA
jgi:hypothetical protein